MSEPLDPRLVYAKTPAGMAEVMHRSEAVSAPARRVLLLVDGRRPLAALPVAVRPGELPALITELLEGGLIRLSGIVEELPAEYGSMRDPRLEDFKRAVAGSVTRELGPAGHVLEARLQDCVNLTVMRGVMREIVELVRTRAGDDAAARVAATAQAAARSWEERHAALLAAAGAIADPPVADAARPSPRPPGVA